MRPFHLFARNNNLRVLGIGQGDALFDLITRELGSRLGKKSDDEQSDDENEYLVAGGAVFPNEHPQNCLHASADCGTFHAQIGRGFPPRTRPYISLPALTLMPSNLSESNLPHCILPQAHRCG